MGQSMHLISLIRSLPYRALLAIEHKQKCVQASGLKVDF